MILIFLSSLLGRQARACLGRSDLLLKFEKNDVEIEREQVRSKRGWEPREFLEGDAYWDMGTTPIKEGGYPSPVFTYLAEAEDAESYNYDQFLDEGDMSFYSFYLCEPHAGY